MKGIEDKKNGKGAEDTVGIREQNQDNKIKEKR